MLSPLHSFFFFFLTNVEFESNRYQYSMIHDTYCMIYIVSSIKSFVLQKCIGSVDKSLVMTLGIFLGWSLRNLNYTKFN